MLRQLLNQPSFTFGQRCLAHADALIRRAFPFPNEDLSDRKMLADWQRFVDAKEAEGETWGTESIYEDSDCILHGFSSWAAGPDVTLAERMLEDFKARGAPAGRDAWGRIESLVRGRGSAPPRWAGGNDGIPDWAEEMILDFFDTLTTLLGYENERVLEHHLRTLMIHDCILMASDEIMAVHGPLIRAWLNWRLTRTLATEAEAQIRG